MPIKINVDSVIDIITNSSTEIFTFPSRNSEKIIKDVVNSILKESGSNLKFDDLFNMETKPTEEAEESFIYWLEENKYEELGGNDDLQKIDVAEMVKKDPAIREKYWNDFLKDTDRNWDRRSERIEITDKTGQNTDLYNKLESIFQSESIEN